MYSKMNGCSVVENNARNMSLTWNKFLYEKEKSNTGRDISHIVVND